jgi:hypothetical protein
MTNVVLESVQSQILKPFSTSMVFWPACGEPMKLLLLESRRVLAGDGNAMDLRSLEANQKPRKNGFTDQRIVSQVVEMGYLL